MGAAESLQWVLIGGYLVSCAYRGWRQGWTKDNPPPEIPPFYCPRHDGVFEPEFRNRSAGLDGAPIPSYGEWDQIGPKLFEGKRLK
jgi:hypothetical protein